MRSIRRLGSPRPASISHPCPWLWLWEARDSLKNRTRLRKRRDRKDVSGELLVLTPTEDSRGVCVVPWSPTPCAWAPIFIYIPCQGDIMDLIIKPARFAKPTGYVSKAHPRKSFFIGHLMPKNAALLREITLASANPVCTIHLGTKYTWGNRFVIQLPRRVCCNHGIDGRLRSMLVTSIQIPRNVAYLCVIVLGYTLYPSLYGFFPRAITLDTRCVGSS